MYTLKITAVDSMQLWGHQDVREHDTLLTQFSYDNYNINIHMRELKVELGIPMSSCK